MEKVKVYKKRYRKRKRADLQKDIARGWVTCYTVLDDDDLVSSGYTGSSGLYSHEKSETNSGDDVEAPRGAYNALYNENGNQIGWSPKESVEEQL